MGVAAWAREGGEGAPAGVCWAGVPPRTALPAASADAGRRVPAAGIDLENIVYYKDDTHYFVMTAKKQSLLDKGVILHVSGRSSCVSHRPGVQSSSARRVARGPPGCRQPPVSVRADCAP